MKDAPELCKPPRGIREKLQAKLAHDGVKATIPERQRLAVHDHGLKHSLTEPGACRREHRRRDISANHASRWCDYGQRAQRGLAWSRSDIEHASAASDFRSSQHGRYEEPRPAAEVPLIRRGVDGPSNGRVESWSEVHVYGRLTVFWCTHNPFRVVCLHK
jgi:hypothetical protein